MLPVVPHWVCNSIYKQDLKMTENEAIIIWGDFIY